MAQRWHGVRALKVVAPVAPVAEMSVRLHGAWSLVRAHLSPDRRIGALCTSCFHRKFALKLQWLKSARKSLRSPQRPRLRKERAAHTRSNHCGSFRARLVYTCAFVSCVFLGVRAARFKCRAVAVRARPVYAHFVRAFRLRCALHVSSCLPFFASHYNLLL
uniref:Uncharacterized protein n=1 Tax=Rhipicephalus zambeziensis TaxID=60191 RepID=A0A224YET9_9ACAR